MESKLVLYVSWYGHRAHRKDGMVETDVEESHLRLHAGGGQSSRQVSIEASPHSCLRMIKARTYTSIVIYEVSKALQRKLATPAPINSDTVLVPTTHQELF